MSKLRSRLKRAIRSLTGGQPKKRAPRETPDPLAYTLGKSQVTIGAFTYGKMGLK